MKMSIEETPGKLGRSFLHGLALLLQDFNPLEKDLAEHCGKIKQGLSDSFKLDGKQHGADEPNQGNKQILCDNSALENLQSFLVVVDPHTATCVHVSGNIQPISGFSKDLIVGSSIHKLIRCSDSTTLDKYLLAARNNCIDGNQEKETKKIHCFGGKFIVKSSKHADAEVQYKDMKSIALIDTFSHSLHDDEKPHLVLLVSPTEPPTSTRGPPNQTINTKGEIPQPEKFSTRQDISGKIITVDTHQSNPPTPLPLTPGKSDLIRRCIRSLFEPRHNGNSLAQILHSQVLNQGQATSPAYKFRLSDGSTVTAQTKSKLMQGKQGDPPFIISLHSIYRDGTLQGLNLPSLPASIKSILSGPVLLESSTTTSSTTVDSKSIQPFIQLGPQNKPQIGADITFSSNWQSSVADSFRKRNGSDVARELLVITGTEESAENIVNEVLSPPPHLDGHLVHSVGGANSQLKSLLSSPAEHTKSEGKMFQTDPLHINSPTLGFMEKLTSVENSLANPAAYPGPPCVDISHIDLPMENGVFPPTPLSNESVMSDNSIGNFSQSNSTSFSSARRVFTPPEYPSAPLAAPRSRSASSTTFSPLENPLKRTVSMTNSDTILTSTHPKPRESKPAKRSKILETILNSPTINDSMISIACDVGPPSFPPMTTHPFPTTPTHHMGPQVSVKTEVIDTNTAPLLTISTQTLFDPLNTLSKEGKPPDTPPKWVSSTAVSQEELEELNDIFNDLDSMHNEMGGELPTFDPNEIFPSSDSMVDHQHKHQFNNIQNGGSTKQMAPNYPPMDPHPPQSNPMFSVAAMASVPTGLETCPNREIPSLTQQRLPHPQNLVDGGQFHTVGVPDPWDGDEPFVDLGTYPPPAGLNPRLPIPMQHDMGSNHPNGTHNPNINPMGNNLQNSNMTRRFPMSSQPTRLLHHNGSVLTNVPSSCITMPVPNGITPQMGDFPSTHMPMAGNVSLHRTTGNSPEHQRSFQYNGGSPHFDGLSNGGIPQYPYQQGMKSDMTHSGIIAQKRNEHFMKQRRLQHELQRSGAPPNGQNQYGNFFLNSPRTMFSPRGPQVATQYQPSPITTYQPRHNEPLYHHQAAVPPIPVPMTSPPSYNVPMTSSTDHVTPTKTTPKRGRGRKPRRTSKSKATDMKAITSSNDVSFWNDVSPTAANQPPPLYRPQTANTQPNKPTVFQMTIRDKHQRPRASYNDNFTSSLDGATWSMRLPSQLDSETHPIVTSQSNTQNLNLNVLLQQYKSMAETEMITSSSSQQIGEMGGFCGDVDSSGYLGGFPAEPRDLNNNPSSLATPTGFETFPPTNNHCDVKNSNVNNNKTTCRYVASVTATPIPTPARDVTSVADTEVTSSESGRHKVSLLESLLLSKDD